MPLNVGFIGTGNIAPAYIKGSSYFPDDVKVIACADVLPDRAVAFAGEYELRASSVEDLLAAPDIDIVINLTIPAVHAEISQQILEAGKHCYSEKPFALNREDGKKILAAAAAKGLKVGCAPDTFLGAGGRTARKAIDDGLIGKPTSAVAFMLSGGPESWHPNPYFFFQYGGGPVLDMAPYYLTWLVNLLGPVAQVGAMAGRAKVERVAGHETIRGQRVPVEIDTHTTGVLRFESGAIGTVVFSFDVQAGTLPRIEIYGVESSLQVPDPNTFGGDVLLWDRDQRQWANVAPVGRSDIQRGVGVADMARAIRDGGPFRASGELAYHVLDIMLSLADSAASGSFVTLESRVDRPDAV
ncbi:MAG: Gfo/Idh/MocA family oxidoreductase [Anaerolineae bacterium]|nr:Gfo/Idh/MocA family oxidoreductase [Anaerolineae bacterium]NUQ04958.1 Gfo/Idh/MocA family oxidoreductase [Anaerolineae bacterium]